MSQKPIFVATHPRACSTAFEMVFMTRPQMLKVIHEPFGDAFYYGPERLGERYELDIQGREASTFANSTFKTVLNELGKNVAKGQRVLLKDMAYYLSPPDHKPASIAPSLASNKRGVGTNGNSAQPAKTPPYPYGTDNEPGNPTVIPKEVLQKFHFAFLIRHPKKAIPSFFRCTVPPQDKKTGFYEFTPSEAGYGELRRLFDYLRSAGEIGPHAAGQNNSNGFGTSGNKGVEICVVDADDLLDHPHEVIEAFCGSVGIDFDSGMLNWNDKDIEERAQKSFAKWAGWHDDALAHTELKPRNHRGDDKTEEEEFSQWVEKFGLEGAQIIRETVNQNVGDYEYLKQYAIQV